jgi:MarR family transcriptional regulator for hemolysin
VCELPHVVFWLKHAHLGVRKLLDETLAEYGLSAAQMEVLGPIACSSNGIEHRALLDLLGVTSPTLTNLVDGLVERGLIERRIGSEDARVKLLHVTRKGQKLWEKLDGLAETFTERLLSGFSPGEVALLTELLKRLAQNVAKFRQLPP